MEAEENTKRNSAIIYKSPGKERTSSGATLGTSPGREGGRNQSDQFRQAVQLSSPPARVKGDNAPAGESSSRPPPGQSAFPKLGAASLSERPRWAGGYIAITYSPTFSTLLTLRCKGNTPRGNRPLCLRRLRHRLPVPNPVHHSWKSNPSSKRLEVHLRRRAE